MGFVKITLKKDTELKLTDGLTLIAVSDTEFEVKGAEDNTQAASMLAENGVIYGQTVEQLAYERVSNGKTERVFYGAHGIEHIEEIPTKKGKK